jgi:uncharacterized protein
VHRLDLSRAETEPLSFSERLAVSAETGGEDVVRVQEVTLSGIVEKDGPGFAVSGSASGEAQLVCSRCLSGFTFAFDETLELRLLPMSAAPQEDETQLGKDDLDVRFFSEGVLDLDELAAEQLELVLPMKPLCKEGCLGLCPRCGADLNQGRCACPAVPDNRWAPLRNWRPGK